MFNITRWFAVPVPGDLDKDAYAPRLFVERGLEIMVAQSYSKNLGGFKDQLRHASAVFSKSMLQDTSCVLSPAGPSLSLKLVQTCADRSAYVAVLQACMVSVWVPSTQCYQIRR